MFIDCATKIFVTENVRGLKWLYDGQFLEKCIADYENAGYNVCWQILNAKNYGVPQYRWRLFIVGVRKDLDFVYQFPEYTHGPGKLPILTLRKSIGHLPDPQKGEFHNDPSISRSSICQEIDVVCGMMLSFTIQASGRHVPLHPSSPPMEKVSEGVAENYKHLTKLEGFWVEECDIIQSFEESDEFVGNVLSQYLQVGNAVPPLLAQNIASCF